MNHMILFLILLRKEGIKGLKNVCSDKNVYMKQKYNRKKAWYRFYIGFMQIIHKPLLNLIWIPVFLLFSFFLYCKDIVIKQADAPRIITFTFALALKIILIAILVLSILYIVEQIGELTARKDEACLILAFDAKHLRFGYPILIQKKKINGTDITFREFYTTIPYQAWIDKKDAIADAMNVHFIEDIQYGGKNHADGNRIILITAKGRKKAKRGNLYDDDF